MIVRELDSNHDWTFGKGRNNYKRNNFAIGQNIETRLLSFLNDCFFDADSGLDWFNILGSKNIAGIKSDIARTILNTSGVSALVELSVNLSETRHISIEYQVVTVYSVNKSLSGSITVGGYSA